MSDTIQATETTKLEVLELVKYRLDITYSDKLIDQSVQSMIDSCKQYLTGAGVVKEQLETPLAIDSYVLWCKMSRDLDNKDLITHPVFTNIIMQLKYGGQESV